MERIHDNVQAQFRQNKIDLLKLQLSDCNNEMRNLKKELLACIDIEERRRINRRIAGTKKRRQSFKDKLLLFGVKVERRGRPSLQPEQHADYGKKKVTVRISQSNYELMSLFKESRQTDSFEQFFDFLFRMFRQLEGHKE